MKSGLLRQLVEMSKILLYGFIIQCIAYNFLLANVGMTQKLSDVFITVNLENTSLEKTLSKIEKLTEFKFLYSDGSIDLERNLNLGIYENISLEELLISIARINNVRFKRINNTIVVGPLKKAHRKKGVVIETLAKTIKGQVLDENGEGLPGVSVFVKGTSIGMATDVDGKYAIDVPEGSILVFTFIGYQKQEIFVGTQTTIEVNMVPDVNQLEEIVVVGFGTQKEESVVGSILSVKPAELKIPSSNLTGALAGRVAGVISYQRSGEPGADNAQFFVRGITTFADGAVPLILIDGVELTVDDLSRLNPDDIESFSVLKDATATAVFGARGANGIIYVTTKEGKTGKAKVSIRFENSFSENTSLPEFADPVTYMRLANEAVNTRTPGARLPFSEEKIFNTANGRNANVFPAVDWQHELLRRFAISQRFNFNVKGGGEVAQYYVAGGFTRDAGILKEDTRTGADNNVNLERYLLRSNVSINLSSSTRAIVRLHATLDNLTGPAIPGNGSPGTNAFTRTLNASPVRFPAIYDTDSASANARNILFGNSVADIGNNMYINPYAELVSGFSRSSNSFSLIQIDLYQDLSALVKGLKFRFRGNSNRNSSFNNSRSSTPFWYNAPLINYNRVTDEYTLLPLNPDGGDESLGFNSGSSAVSNVLYAEFAFNYDRTFAEKHSLSGMVVGIAREFIDGNASNLELSLPSRNLGVSGRFTYGYKDRYFSEFNFGYNGSERFARNSRFGFFPSFGVGWNISNEPFFEGLSAKISRLKLRGSYGWVGNDAIGGRNDRFFYISQVNPRDNSRGYPFGAAFRQFISGVSIGRYQNNEIVWEVGRKFNIGVELNFLDDAIQIRADYFTETRDNILVNRVVPQSLGLQAPVRANIGKAFTEGLDASIEANRYINNNLWVVARGNFTYANGKVKRIEEPDYSLQNAPSRFITGTKINQQFGFIAERLFIDEEDVRNSPTQSFPGGPPVQAGDIKYRDINEDGLINDLDRVPIGKPTTPQVTYGLGFSIGSKKLDVSVFFQGVAEASLFIDPGQTAPFVTRTGFPRFVGLNRDPLNAGVIGESALLKAYADDHWSETNPDIYALYPRLSAESTGASQGLNTNNSQRSTWWLRDGAFMRLKQVELGYTLYPETSGIESVRLYVTGTNLLHWSRFKLWDPELGGNGFGYPLQRVVNVGVLANF